MKKQYIYSALVLTALLTAGCAKEIENTLDGSDSSAIELSSVSTDPMTKAVITGTSFTTDEAAAGIGLFLLDGNGKAYGDNAGNVRYGYNDGKWTASQPLRIGNTKGTLVGYYPYSEGATNVKAIPVASSINGTDYLYGSIAEITSAKAKTESLTLSHALTRLRITFKRDNSFVGSGTLSSLTIEGNGIAASGTLNATTGEISATKSAFTVSNLNATINSDGLTEDCLVVPAASSATPQAVTLKFTVDGKAYKVDLADALAVKLQSGIQTDITLTVKNTSVSVDGSSIGAWGDGGSRTVTVGGDHTVTVKLAEGIAPHDLLVEAYADGNVVKILVFSQLKSPLICVLSVGADLSKEQKADGVTVFTISNIGSDVTATIHYTFTVSVSANDINYGTVSGGGSYLNGTTTTLTATANTGYIFYRWRDANGNILDWTNPKEITVTSDMKVTAEFGYPNLESNVLNGIFTVNKSGKTILFSKGNLYCSGVEFDTDGTVKSMDNAYWGFEDNQFGHTPKEDKVSRNKDHISHFMWCKDYQNSLASKYNSEWNNQTVFFVNNIPVFNEDNRWSVLSKDEWVYLLNTEGTTDGSARNQTNRFAKAKVNRVNGVLLFPDGYLLPDGYNSDGGSGMSKINDIRATYPEDGIPNWGNFEAAGVVFLPAAGVRYGYWGNAFSDIVSDVGTNVYLWSSSPTDGGKAYCMFFGTTFANPSMDKAREYALSVRLVTEYH